MVRQPDVIEAAGPGPRRRRAVRPLGAARSSAATPEPRLKHQREHRAIREGNQLWFYFGGRSGARQEHPHSWCNRHDDRRRRFAAIRADFGRN
jgi:hypothetical protein